MVNGGYKMEAPLLRNSTGSVSGSISDDTNSPHDVGSSESGNDRYDWDMIDFQNGNSGLHGSMIKCLGCCCCCCCCPRRASPKDDAGSVPEDVCQEWCLTAEDKLKIEAFERRRTDIMKEEIELDKRCDGIVLFVIQCIALFVVMLGAGTVCGVVLSSQDYLYVLLGLLLSSFMFGVGMASAFGFIKLKKLKWMMGIIKDFRIALRNDTRAMKDTISVDNYGIKMIPTDSSVSVSMGRRKLDCILDSLQSSSGSYERDHFVFLVIIAVASAAYMLAIAMLVYFMHADDKRPIRVI